MTPIVLVALNAEYQHTAFGLRCLMAKLGPLGSRAVLRELTIHDEAAQIVASEEVAVNRRGQPHLEGLALVRQIEWSARSPHLNVARRRTELAAAKPKQTDVPKDAYELHAFLAAEARLHREDLYTLLKRSLSLLTGFGALVILAASWFLYDNAQSARAAAQLAAQQAKTEVMNSKEFKDAVESAVVTAGRQATSKTQEISEQAVREAEKRASEAIDKFFSETAKERQENLFNSLQERVAKIDVEQLAKQLTSERLSEVPVGTIAVWPTDVPSQSNKSWHKHWHPCDGSLLSAEGTDGHPLLAQRLSGRYDIKGQPTPAGKVRLPNFQGRFLRGFGKSSKAIGEPQGDAIGKHSHHYGITTERVSTHRMNDHWKNLEVRGTQPMDTSTNGAEETRPINYAVHWIIRVK